MSSSSSSPSETYGVMASVAANKTRASWGAQFVQGVLAGVWISIGALLANRATATTGSALVGGAVFPVGLVAIFITGGNLFTGNCMYCVPTLVHPAGDIIAAGRARTLLWLGLSWLSNFCGAILGVYFLAHLTKLSNDEPTRSFVIKNAEKKVNLDWGVALLRGVGANLLVCLAWWQALSSRSTEGKIISIWIPIFTFTALGFEHSIANMAYVDFGLLASRIVWRFVCRLSFVCGCVGSLIGELNLHLSISAFRQEGADATFWEFLGYNLAPVTLGNFIGGAGFGLAQWLTYKRFLASSEEKQQQQQTDLGLYEPLHAH